MTDGERIGLEAVLLDEQFQAGLDRYLAGLDAMEAATGEAKSGAMQMSQALKGVDTSIEESAQSNVELAASVELVEKAYSQAEELIRSGLGLAELGANFDRQQARFEAFAEQAGGAAANLEAFQRGAGGTVNKMEAMTSASQLLQMGIVGNAAEMEKVVEAATRLGDQTQSAGDRVSDFALMLANTSIPRLDAYGLSAGYVRERIIELQEANFDMTREQAFAQAVFEASERSLATLGDRVEDNAAKMEQARAKIEDTRIEVGQKLAGAAGVAAGTIAEMESSTIALVTAMTGAFGIATKFSGGLGPLIEKLGTSGKALGALGVELAILVAALERADAQFEKMEKAQDAARESGAGVADGLKDLTAGSTAWGAEIDSIAAKMEQATEKYNKNIVTGGILGDMLGTDAEFAATMGAAVSALDREIQEGTENYSQYITQVELANEALKETGQSIVAVDQASFEMHKRIQQSKVDWENLTNAERENQEAIMDSIQATQGLTWAEIEAKAAREADIDAIKMTAEELKAVDEAMSAVDAKMFTLIKAKEDGVIVTDEEEAAQKRLVWALEESREKQEAYQQKLEETRQRQEEAAQAAQEHTVALLEQAEALSDVDAAGAASAAIDGLNQLLDEGALSLEEYQELVRGVQDDYGLVGEEGRALAEGMDALNARLASGTLSMEDYRAQLDALIDTQVGSIEATKAQAEAIKEAEKEAERAAKEVEKEAERQRKEAERDAEREREKAEREAEKLAEKVARDIEREMEAAAKAAEELPGRLFDALSGLGQTAMKTLEDELKPLDEELKTVDESLEQWRRALEDPTADLEDQQKALQQIGELEAERARLAAERAEQEARIAEFQEAQQQMQLLQQQLDLMKLVQEHGLDAQEVLGGLTADASASEIVEATTAAMQQIIEQTQADLNFGGSSATTMTQAPVFAPPTMAGVSNSTQNTFQLGGNNINSGMDEAQFEAMIRRVLAEAIP
jgi:hypothetical protein